MQCGRGSVGQERSLTAGKHGGHPLAPDRHVRSPDRVDTLVDPVQPPRGDTGVHRSLTETESQELGERDNAMLAGSQSDDGAVD
jgi:hypothetical protein